MKGSNKSTGAVGDRRCTAAALAIALTAIIALPAAPAQATKGYVANNGSDANACNSKALACRSVSRAIAYASDGDTVEVGPGIYGDLNGDGTLGNSAGEETLGCGGDCMIEVNKTLTIISSHGANSTVLNAPGGTGVESAVHIATNGVVFGKLKKGFTIINPVVNGSGLTVFSSVTSGVKVQGNVAEAKYGFRLNGNGTLVKGNLAMACAVGFSIFATSTEVTGNRAWGNSESGFTVADSSGAALTKNLAAGNGTGFVIWLSPSRPTPLSTFERNSMVGNWDAGAFVGTEDGFSESVGLVLEKKNSFLGNGDAGGNCGLRVNNQDTDNLFMVFASGNFWGAASGPGLEPADAVGGSCNWTTGTGSISVFTSPPATSETRVLPPTMK